MTEPTQRTIEANGIRMHVTEQGQGPVVILCHGFPETGLSWRRQVPALAAAGYRAVAPDLRGYGGTDSPADAGRYTLLDLVGDMVGLLDALGAPTAAIVGNDWGATLAWHAALLRPDRFVAVAALGVPMMAQPPLPPSQLFPQTAEALFYTLYFQPPGVAEAEFERDVATTLRKIWFAASGDAGPRGEGGMAPNPFGMVSRSAGLLGPLPDPPALPAWLPRTQLQACAEAFSRSGFRGGLNFYRCMDRNRELLAGFQGRQVAVPALYLVGERDTGLSMPGMRDIIARMPALVPQLEGSATVPGAGHWLQQESPAEVNAALLRFLARHMPA